ncbi:MULTISPECIES: hypothetical protein [Streptomyces]|uniref:hypothetical protein n=1 Tax=Streptomyces TaxID=1883 RepID=UPI001A94E5C1|nr:hypothetical protein [Streptomyces laculatispora]MBO0914186.1 hypothetical protein [Streptomyces laculatispora]WSS88040.1 hypothetical protein OG199_35870 [Streptomyces sp. NBC_01176]
MSDLDGLISPEEAKNILDSADPRIAAEEECRKQKVEHNWQLQNTEPYLRVGLPNGRDKKWRVLNKERSDAFLRHNFASVTHLGDLDACLFRDTGVIEASILPRTSGTSWRYERAIIELPGIRRVSGEQSTPDEEQDADPAPDVEPNEIKPEDDWVLGFERPEGTPFGVEIGTASERFSEFSTRGNMRRGRVPGTSRPDKFTTLRISGVTATRHDEALRILKRVSDSLFFELDLRFDTALKVAPARPARYVRRRRSLEDPGEGGGSVTRSPRTQYAEKPLSLYWYARSAVGLPLLEFLAYYQVLEYHFRSYSRRGTLDKIRHELRDPRFDVEDDSDLERILTLTSQSGEGFGSEREQLKATVRGCVAESHVRDFIKNDPWLTEHFDADPLKGVTGIDANNKKTGYDLLSQLADRVYDIRCRIVHAKEDGKAPGEKTSLLLPFSKEVESLGPDIALVKFLAQKCLIAGASRLRP